MTSKPIDFITLAEVMEIHQNQISLYGGKNGIRDINLLSSALALPKATFDGEYLLHLILRPRDFESNNPR